MFCLVVLYTLTVYQRCRRKQQFLALRDFHAKLDPREHVQMSRRYYKPLVSNVIASKEKKVERTFSSEDPMLRVEEVKGRLIGE